MITLTNTGNTAKIEILSDIGQDWFGGGFTLDSFRDQLRGLDVDVLDIEIKSNGGDALEALALYDEIRGMNCKVRVKYVGASASAATIIGSAADQREITENSRFLVHPVQAAVQGTSEDLKKTAEMMDGVDEQIVNIYRRITGRSRSEILSLMKEDKWLTAQEALAWGFVTSVIKNEPKINNLKNEAMDINELMELLGVESEDQILEAVMAMMDKVKALEEQLAEKEAIEAEKKEEEVEEFVNSLKNKGLKDEAIESFRNIARVNIADARRIVENIHPRKLKDVVNTAADKPEPITKEVFMANFKANLYEGNKELYRAHFREAFGKEPVN